MRVGATDQPSRKYDKPYQGNNNKRLNVIASIPSDSKSWAPKFNDKGQPRCFGCDKFRHIHRDCPTGNKTQLNLVTTPIRLRRIAKGEINRRVSKDILLDSGADVTLVHPRLIYDEVKLSERITSSGGQGSAEVELDIMGRKQSLRVGVSATIPHDALIGLDFADCPMMVAEVYQEQQNPNVSIVTTRSQTKGQRASTVTEGKVESGTLKCPRSPRGCTAGTKPSSHSSPDPVYQPTTNRSGEDPSSTMTGEEDEGEFFTEPMEDEDEIITELSTTGEGVGSPGDQPLPRGDATGTQDPSSQLPTSKTSSVDRGSPKGCTVGERKSAVDTQNPNKPKQTEAGRTSRDASSTRI